MTRQITVSSYYSFAAKRYFIFCLLNSLFIGDRNLLKQPSRVLNSHNFTKNKYHRKPHLGSFPAFYKNLLLRISLNTPVGEIQMKILVEHQLKFALWSKCFYGKNNADVTWMCQVNQSYHWENQNLVLDQHCAKIKFSIKGFFSNCDQIRSHLLKKSIMEASFFV